MNRTEIIEGDALAMLRTLPDTSVQTCVTSPPYWGLRDYGVAGQLGLEPTPAEYVARMVEVFAEVRRVLREDGTLWLNLGDSYSSGGRTTQCVQTVRGQVVDNKRRPTTRTTDADAASGKHAALNGTAVRPGVVEGLAGKQLIGIPWRIAFALQDAGWWLRMDVIWHKPNPMPESVTDRPTKAHEYLFLFTKSARYYYDAAAIAEPLAPTSTERLAQPNLAGQCGSDRVPGKTNGSMKAVRDADNPGLRNARSVWTITTQPFSQAHFATFPPELPRRCILAGSSALACSACGAAWRRTTGRPCPRCAEVIETQAKECESCGYRNTQWREQREANAATRAGESDTVGPLVARKADLTSQRVVGEMSPACECGAGPRPCLVLDPFAGAGTTGLVAHRLQRDFIGIELNPKYAAMARRRISNDAPLFTGDALL